MTLIPPVRGWFRLLIILTQSLILVATTSVSETTRLTPPTAPLAAGSLILDATLLYTPRGLHVPETLRALDTAVAYRDDDTIFISVASFRDPLCVITVRELYTKARNPKRIFLGIIEQNYDEPSCIPPEFMNCSAGRWCVKDNIHIRKVSPKNARGPTFGRYVSSLMYRGEKYYMMIDSHNRFVEDWDREMIAMYLRTPGQKKILSHYPNLFVLGEPVDLKMVMMMCRVTWIPEFHFTRNKGEWVPVSGYSWLQPYTAAGFLFGDGALFHEVPFDPHLDFLFDGEELLYSVRLWTHGWDLYAPALPLLFHSYDRHTAKRFWHEDGNEWQKVQAVSRQRVQRMLKSTFNGTTTRVVPDDMKVDPRVMREYDKYGLGKMRTVEEFWQFAQVDTVKRTDGYSFCEQRRR